MNKVFQNPVVVGVMVMVAIGTVIYQAIPKSVPDRPADDAAEAAATSQKPTPKGTVAKAEPPPKAAGPGIDLARATWIEQPRRGGFSPPPPPSLQAPEPSAEAASAGGWLDRGPSMSLTAVLVQGEGRFAVINDEIVGEGDTIEGARVESILADRVLLRGNDGPLIVRFSQEAAPPPGGEPPSGGIPVAD